MPESQRFDEVAAERVLYVVEKVKSFLLKALFQFEADDMYKSAMAVPCHVPDVTVPRFEVPPVTERPFDVERPTAVIPPANVEVAVEVEVRVPTVSLPMVEEETSSFMKANGEVEAE